MFTCHFSVQFRTHFYPPVHLHLLSQFGHNSDRILLRCSILHLCSQLRPSVRSNFIYKHSTNFPLLFAGVVAQSYFLWCQNFVEKPQGGFKIHRSERSFECTSVPVGGPLNRVQHILRSKIIKKCLENLHFVFVLHCIINTSFRLL